MRPINPLYYVYMAVGSILAGIVLTFILILVCAYFGIDITKNIWVVALPVAASVLLNVFLLEMYRKYHH